MNFPRIIGRVAGVLALTVALAGCIDVTMDLEIQSETQAKVTTTSTIGADIYPMLKAGAAGEQGSETESFCNEAEGAVLTENADGSATCVEVKQGSLEEALKGDTEDEGASYTIVSPGVIRVAFSTKDMQTDVNASAGGEQEMDAETKAMMQTFFEGHFITLRVSGKRITESNMTLAGDGKSAEMKIPFLDLMNGTASLPDELYAIVDTN